MAVKDSLPTIVRLADFLGLEVTKKSDTSYVANCPFCDKEQHLFFHPNKESKEVKFFKCHRCDESGNAYSFMQAIYKYSLDVRSDDDVKQVFTEKSIPSKVLLRLGVVRNVVDNMILIPGKNKEGKVVNLYKWDTHNNRVLGCPGTDAVLLGIDSVTDPTLPLFVAEGHWDWMILDHCFQVTGERDKVNVVAVPGASNFKVEWFTPLLKAAEITLLFDNDHPKLVKSGKTIQPGKDGMKKLCTVLDKANFPNPVNVIGWPDGLDDGYDIRDLFIDVKNESKTPAKDTLTRIRDMLVPSAVLFPEAIAEAEAEEEESQFSIDPIACESFDELIAAYKEGLFVTPSLEQGLACLLATCISTQQKPENVHVWLYLMAPPSSGKTTLCDAIAAVGDEFVISQSKFSGLFSGWKSGRSKKDNSLIARLDDKTLVIKDFTTIISMPAAVQDSLYGELRDAYDGRCDVHYRNGIDRHYRKRFTVIAAVTDEILKVNINNTALGERFLTFDMTDAFHGSRKHISTGVDGITDDILSSFTDEEPKEDEMPDISSDRLRKIHATTAGYLLHLKKNWRKFRISTDDEQFKKAKYVIESIGMFIAKVRAKVTRDRDRELVYRPNSDIGLRLAGQLMKLALNLAIVLGEPTITDKVLNIIRKVAKDTAKGIKFEIVEKLCEHPLGLTAEQLAAKVKISKTSAKRVLEDLYELRFAAPVSVPNNSGTGGRNRHSWHLTPRYQALWEDLSGVPLSEASKKLTERQINTRIGYGKRKVRLVKR